MWMDPYPDRPIIDSLCKPDAINRCFQHRVIKIGRRGRQHKHAWTERGKGTHRIETCAPITALGRRAAQHDRRPHHAPDVTAGEFEDSLRRLPQNT